MKSGTLYGSDFLGSRVYNITKGNNIYVMIDAESEDEARALYDMLSAEGEVEMVLGKMFWGDLYASFRDKYGTWWMINYSYPKK